MLVLSAVHREIAAALAALYLRGVSPLPPTSAATRSAVLGALLRNTGPVEARLKRGGFALEASVLGSPGVVDSAERLISKGRAITCVCPSYPPRWRLFPWAPSALWLTGELPDTQDCLTIVGSRHVAEEVLMWSADAGIIARELGLVVVNGGAEGCDTAANPDVEIWPCGIQVRCPSARATLSVCPPSEPFSTAAAMERNAMLYAISRNSVAVHARLRAGGTWHGALDAIRRRSTQLWVSDHCGDAGKALVAVGAGRLHRPDDILRLESLNPEVRQLHLAA